MNEIAITSLYILSGIFIYATFNHLIIGLRRPFSFINVIFAGMTALMIPIAFSEISILRASTVMQLAFALKVNIAAWLGVFALLPWLISIYTSSRPLLPVVGLNALLALLFLVNLFQPYSLQYSEVTGLGMIHMPWGELTTRAEGHISNWFFIAIVGITACFAYGFYALTSHYRRSGQMALGMMLTTGLWFLGLILGVTMRIMRINLELGPVIIVAGLVIVSIMLSRETHQKIHSSEERLRSSEEKLRLILENAPYAVYVLGFDGKGLYVNRPAEILSGRSRDELLSMHFLDLVHSEDRGPLLQMREARLTGKPAKSQYTLRILNNSGSVHWVENQVMVLPWEGKLATLNFLQDITERKRADEEKVQLQKQLQQAQKMEAVGQLAGGIAHDFNNILTVIASSANLFEMKLDKTSPLRTYTKYILDASAKGANLISGLLAFSRTQPFYPASVDLNDIIREVEPLIRRIVPEDIEIKITPSDIPLVVMADKTQLDQVLMNLVANARDAILAKGMISIGVEHVEPGKGLDRAAINSALSGCALLTVSDSGSGMTEKTKEKIFEPFFTTKEVGKGTGLGLSQVYGIIVQHGGTIDVHSSVGIGTTMKIYLPLSADKGQEAVAQPTGFPRGGTETILLAEDDPDVRDVTVGLLNEFGYKVIVAVDGEDAVKMFRDNYDAVSLVLLDVIMPKMNGEEAYDRMKEIDPWVKTIFMSGYAGDILQSRLIIEDGLHYIAKPVSPVALLTKVREVLDSEGVG